MITVHVIFNAHIDPIWLWPWQDGLDVVLATCRSACERLESNPDLAFTQGEAWVYRQIETIAPALFERIRKHVATGRWEIVGGWWVQPDCNLPSGFGMERQIEMGRRYFMDKWGRFPRVGYNIDSFGHAATLPGYMRAAGQDRYIMMRPQEHEMNLPGRVFRWRGYEGGPEVVTFRIAGQYATWNTGELDHVRRSLADLPPGIEHTMCFAGIGDHGGGPTEAQVAWLRQNANAIEGCRLVFSTPSRFFDAIAAQSDLLPLVTGELQHHAIGCYTAYRPIKLAVRRAEHILAQAQGVVAKDKAAAGSDVERIDEAWRTVCTHHFHDTFGGTCIPSAYRQVEAQLGGAYATGDEIIHHGLRRLATAMPAEDCQRFVLMNASDQPFEGYTSFEPWLDWRGWGAPWQLLDEQGRHVPLQKTEPEAVIGWDLLRLLVRIKAGPGEVRVLRFNTTGVAPIDVPAGVSVDGDKIVADTGAAASPEALRWNGGDLSPRLELIDDPTDTWTHGIDRYPEGPAVPASWQPAVVIDKGPLMASLVAQGEIGGSALRSELRVYRGEAFVEWLLRVTWTQTRKMLKLTLPLPAAVEGRIDGIMGGQLDRALDGVERPLRDWTLLQLAGGQRLGVVCPDVFAMDATSGRARFTLLRSPLMAHHDPRAADTLRPTVGDQGVHDFRFRIFLDRAVTAADLDRHALMLQRPPVLASVTHGMKPRTP